MRDLIEALTIFLKYTDKDWPTACEHDVLYVAVDPVEVSDEDIKRLEELGFSVDYNTESFYSYKYGSC